MHPSCLFIRWQISSQSVHIDIYIYICLVMMSLYTRMPEGNVATHLGIQWTPWVMASCKADREAHVI
jgi:hypothetical protein